MDFDPQVIELQVRVAHQEKALAELSEVVTAQWKKIDALEFMLKRTREEMQNLNIRADGEDPPPPHY